MTATNNPGRKTLTISSRTWYGRSYLMWKNRYATFKVEKLDWHWEDDLDHPGAQKQVFTNIGYQDNLCHMVRVALFWAPLNWFLRGRIWEDVNYHKKRDIADTWQSFAAEVPPVLYLLLGIFTYFIGLSFWNAPLKTGLTFFGIVGGIAALIGLIIGIPIYVEHRKKVTAAKRQTLIMQGKFAEAEPKEPHIGRVLWRFAVARKHRVCPLIQVEKEEVTSNS